MKKLLVILVLAAGFSSAGRAVRGVPPLREQMIFRAIPPVIATTVVTPTGAPSCEIESRPATRKS